jgi:hypothetical protein
VIYIAVFIALILVRYGARRSRSLKGQLYWPVLVFLFLFSALRFEVGCDWSGYLNQYLSGGSTDIEDVLGGREPLWWLAIGWMSAFDLPYPWLNVVAAVVFFAGIHALARRQADPLGFLILLFPILIINLPMSGIRQGAAIGVVCIAFVAFLDRSLWRFVLLTLIASMLHASALVLLLLAPLVNGAYSWKRLTVAALLAIPGAFALLSGEYAELATARYIGTGVDAAGAAFRVGLLFITGAFFFILLQQRWKRACPEDYKLINIGAIMMLMSIALVPISSVIGDRLGYYLIPIQAMIFARVPFLPPLHGRSFYTVAPYLGLFVVFVVWTLFSEHFQVCYLPYKTWLFGFPHDAGYAY